MPVVPVVRHVLRGRIRAQAQYELVLGQRLVNAYHLNPELLLFTGLTGPGSSGEFLACLAQMKTALATRA